LVALNASSEILISSFPEVSWAWESLAWEEKSIRRAGIRKIDNLVMMCCMIDLRDGSWAMVALSLSTLFGRNEKIVFGKR